MQTGCVYNFTNPFTIFSSVYTHVDAVMEQVKFPSLPMVQLKRNVTIAHESQV